MRGAVLVLAIIAAPAMAQSVDTTCVQTGAFTNCTSDYSPPAGQTFNNGVAAMGKALADRRARRAAQQNAELQQLFNDNIANLIQAGNCDQATQLAIRFGRYDAVNAVAVACRPGSAPQQAPSLPSQPASNLPICNQIPRPDPCQPG